MPEAYKILGLDGSVFWFDENKPTAGTFKTVTFKGFSGNYNQTIASGPMSELYQQIINGFDSKYDVNSAIQLAGFNSMEEFLKFKVGAVDKYVPTIFEEWKAFHKRFAHDQFFENALYNYKVFSNKFKREGTRYFLGTIKKWSGVDV